MPTLENKQLVVKVFVDDTWPEIWRRIHIPGNFNFKQLERVIRTAMEWHGDELHLFEMKNPATHRKCKIAPRDGYYQVLWKPYEYVGELEAIVGKFFSETTREAKYKYDFGDSWDHILTLEEVIDDDGSPARCVAGEGFAPPVGCGGVDDYHRLMDVLGDPLHSKHEKRRHWAERMRAKGRWASDKVLSGAKFVPDSVNEKIRIALEQC